MAKIWFRIKAEPLATFIDRRLLPSTLSETDLYFEQLSTNFPKLKFWEWTEKEILEYIEKFLQVHSLRCKKCIEGKQKCQKMEILINIVEIL